MTILIIDNYDSFVFNLSRYCTELNFANIVVRNDKITIQQIKELNPSHIIISPGPQSPLEAGLSIRIVEFFSEQIPILGICLGHQVIGHVYGGMIERAIKPMHGKSSLIFHQGSGIYQNIPSPFKVGRYHSLIVNGSTLNKKLIITAQSHEGEIMSFASHDLKIAGLQFHPESILTEYGHLLIKNFIIKQF